MANLLPRVRLRYKGIAAPAVDPVDVAGPGAAEQRPARAQRVLQIGEAGFFLPAQHSRQHGAQRRQQYDRAHTPDRRHRGLTVAKEGPKDAAASSRAGGVMPITQRLRSARDLVDPAPRLRVSPTA